MRDSRDASFPVIPSEGAWNQATPSVRPGYPDQGVQNANFGLSQEQMADLMRRSGATSPQQAIEWARRMPLGGTGDGTTSMALAPQFVAFALGPVECALPREVVLSVERLPEIAHVPNLADWVLGVVQVRGEIVSVVDLRRFFGLPAQPPTPQSYLVVARMREMVISFLVDRQPRTLASATIGEHGSVPPWAQQYAQGTIPTQEQPVIVLNPEALLFGEKMHHYRAEML